MPILFNEQAANLNSQGQLTLGVGGASVKTGDNFDTTYPYAHNDLWMTIPLGNVVPVSVANVVWAYTAASNPGLFGLAGTVASAATPQVGIQIPIPQRTFSPSGVTAPHGYVLNSVDVVYGISGVAINTLTASFTTELTTNAVTRSAVSVTPLGTVAYQNPIGTVVSLPPTALTGTTLPVVMRVVPGTRAWITTDQTELNMSLTLGCNGSSVVTIMKVQARFSQALY